MRIRSIPVPEAHPIRPHGYSIADSDGVEPEPDHARPLHPLLHVLGQLHEVHVARVALVPHRRNADLQSRMGEWDG